jgi:hypothetical protein
MADTAYDGIFGNGISFTFTPTTGTPFGTAQAQVETFKSPPLTVETPTFPPISGDNAGSEQFVLGLIKIQKCPIKATYSKTMRAAAIACAVARVKGTLVVTHGDGALETCVGAALTGITPGEENATGLITDDLEFTVPMGSLQHTFATGAGITVVNSTVVMAVGAGTLDLYAAPYTGDGKAPIRLYLLNSSAHAITIATGATTGYDGFGTDFSITLEPGESVALNGTTDISDTVKLLNVTGTLAEVLTVQVHLQ